MTQKPKPKAETSEIKKVRADNGPKRFDHHKPSPLNPDSATVSPNKPSRSPLNPGDGPVSWFRRIGPIEYRADKDGKQNKVAEYRCTACNRETRVIRCRDVEAGRSKSCGCIRRRKASQKLKSYWARIKELDAADKRRNEG